MSISVYRKSGFVKGTLIYLLAIVLALSGVNSLAHAPEFNFSRISSYNSLSSLFVTKMVQEADGYIWIGTVDGLNRFDGMDIKAYRSREGLNTPGLAGNQIDDLFVDSSNRLWVASPYGISLYNAEQDRFNGVITTYELAGVPDAVINRIFQDTEGRLVVSVANALYCLNEETFLFEQIFSSPLGDISAIDYDRNGGFWLGHYNGGAVFYYHSYGDSLPGIILSCDLLATNPSFTVTDISVDDKNLWVGIEEGGLVRYTLKSGEVKKYFDGTSERFVFDLYRDRKGNLWSCDYSGVKLYIEADEDFRGYYHNQRESFSLRPNVQGLFQDFQGNYYTYHNGIGVFVSYLDRGFQLFNESGRFYWHLTNHNISSICEDAEGNLWMGGFNGGIDIFEWQTGRMIRHNPSDNLPNRLGRGSVLAIFRDRNNEMWIGTHSGGLQRYDKENNRFLSWRHSDSPGSISMNDVRAIAEDELGNLWVATHGGGVNYFDRERDYFYHYDNKNSHLGCDWINDLLIDTDGRLWVGTAYGLSVLEKGEKVFKNYFAGGEDEHVFFGNQILSLFLDSRGRVWLGTNFGLYYHEPQTDGFVRRGARFENQYISSIEEDLNGQLWISTHGGLYQLDPDSDTFFFFDEVDGLQGNTFNLNASYFSGGEALFFAGSKGVNAFNPDKLHYNLHPPQLRFTRFLLFNKEVTEYGKGGVMDKHIDVAKEIVLRHYQNFFSLEFVALNMFNPDRNEYLCIMEGFDDDWVELGNRRTATYMNLPPGKYTFKVKAANNDGVWNEEGISVRIRVLPPWWATVWFYGLIVLVLFVITLLVHNYRTNSLRRQKRRLAHLVAEQTWKLRKNNRTLKQRTVELNNINLVLGERQRIISEQSEELESQAENLQRSNAELLRLIKTKDKLFSIIAHDLRAPFNTIMGFSSLLMEFCDVDDKEQVRKYSTYVHDASLQVFNLLENLLYWARSQTNEIQVSPSDINLNEIVLENIYLVRESAIKKQITVNSGDFGEYRIFADANMMRTVLRNLLINAIKFTSRGGVVSLSAQKRDGFVKISVADTGIGIPEKEVNTILTTGIGISQNGTEGEKGSGLGLLLCKEFVARNGGVFMVESEPGKGSVFSFTLPESLVAS